MIGGGHDPHRIHRGVHQLDQIDRFLGDPVGPGEAQVTAAGIEHLDDVLRLEDLRLELGHRQGRPVATPVVGQADAGIAQELDDTLLHPALGQCQMDDGGRMGRR